MSLPARITDLQPLATIFSGELDSEYNNLVNILNGTDQTKSIRVRNNDNAFAVARFDQLGASANILELYSGGVEVGRVEKDGDLVCLGLTGANGIYTFGSIPVFPASDPTTANQGVRKAYVDAGIFGWSASFQEFDPSTGTVSTEDRQMALIPAGTTWKLTKVGVKYSSGSHTSGGDVTFTFRRRGPSGLLDFGAIHLDNTNNAVNTLYVNDIADVDLLPDDTITYLMTRSGSITERAVSLFIQGTRLRV